MLPTNIFFIEAEFLSNFPKWLPFILSVFGIITASLINIANFNFFTYKKVNLPLIYFLSLASKKWYIDILYNRIFVNTILNFGYLVSFKTLDRGFIELLGPYGISRLIKTQSKNLTSLQTGQLTHYLFFMVLGICCFFIINTLLFSMNNPVLDYRLIGLFTTLITFI